VINNRPDETTTMGALRRAFEAHYGSLVLFATLLTRRQDTAEDLVQESFVRAAQRLVSLPVDEARPYLRATIVNQWRNARRRSLLDDRRDHVVSPTAEAPLEERDALWQAICRLPTRQRACIVLRYYEDLSERDAAAVLGCSIGTVKSQTSRALTRLRKEYPDED